jgi:polyisoprenoid-binding protein YceI
MLNRLSVLNTGVTGVRPLSLCLALTLAGGLGSASALAATPAKAVPKAQAVASAPAAPQVTPAAKLVAAGSEVLFTAKQLGVPLEGRFKKFDAQVALDPRQPQSGRVSVQIELGSAAVNADTDAELGKPEWFNTAKFPKATFVSRAIKATGAGRFDVAGTLTIKGVAREVVVPVALAAAGGQTTATGSMALKRIDFKVGDGDWADTSVVANDVQVRFKLLLQGMPPL